MTSKNERLEQLEQLGLVAEIDRAALAPYCSAWGDHIWAERRIAELEAQERDSAGASAAGAARGDAGRMWSAPSGYN